MFFGLGLASILPLLAQPSPPPPTQAQLALLDQIQGVGNLKFGAKLESFDKDSLKPIGVNAGNPTSAGLSFQYLKTSGVSWGTLQPSKIELRFYYGQLAGIILFFDKERGDLIAVSQALTEKYGATQTASGMRMEDASSSSGPTWMSGNIQMTAAMPDTIPPGSNADYLKQVATGAVQILDIELYQKLSQEKHDEVQQEMLKGHDLEKIKADL